MMSVRCCAMVTLPVAVILATMSGCKDGGAGTVPVEGTVTLDGAPVEGASVVFMPLAGGPQSTGQTDASGKFKLTTVNPGDGAVVGTHAVAVSKSEAVASATADPNSPQGTQLSGAPTGGRPKPAQSLLPSKYSDASNSGIKIEVKSGMEPVKIELSSK